MNKKIIPCPGCNGRGYIYGGGKNSAYAKACDRCHGYGFLRVDRTNADRIRDMTDEELAAMLIQIDNIEAAIPFCKYLPTCMEALDNPEVEPEAKCVDCLLDWLRQPVEEARFPSGFFLDKQESGLTEED